MFETEIFLPANVSVPPSAESDCYSLGGKINLNPNNSPDNEFLLNKPDGTQISRDDLHMVSPVDASGMYYAGKATDFWVKPKGADAQRDFSVDGTAFDLENKNLYHVYGEFMKVKIWNDHMKNGKAMGHWWIEVSSPCGGVTVSQAGAPEKGSSGN